MLRPFALLALVVVALAAAPAGAQELSDRSFRIGANLALGVAGEFDAYVTTRSGGSSTTNHGDADANPSVGFDLRGEIPVADFLVVGGWFEVLTIQSDADRAQREATFGFDGYARLRWVFEPADGLFFEPYALLPIGFTGAVIDDDDGSGDDVWPGWNTGLLAGLQVLSDIGLGGYVELGWRHGEVYHSGSITVLGVTVDADTSIVLNELAMNFGVVYAFGS